MIGTPLKRRENGRLVTGRGSYVHDIQLPACPHFAIVRSLHAHAFIRAVDAAAWRARQGLSASTRSKDLPELRDALPPPVMNALDIWNSR